MAKFKVGDRVRCKPGFKRSDSDGYKESNDNAGGSGYDPGLVFTISTIRNTTDRGIPCYFGGRNGNGVYEVMLELESDNQNYDIY